MKMYVTEAIGGTKRCWRLLPETGDWDWPILRLRPAKAAGGLRESQSPAIQSSVQYPPEEDFMGTPHLVVVVVVA